MASLLAGWGQHVQITVIEDRSEANTIRRVPDEWSVIQKISCWCDVLYCAFALHAIGQRRTMRCAVLACEANCVGERGSFFLVVSSIRLIPPVQGLLLQLADSRPQCRPHQIENLMRPAL